MANRCFLEVSDFDQVYPEFNSDDFDYEKSIVVCRDWAPPLMWFFLFEDQDLKTTILTDEAFLEHPLLAPIALREDVIKRLEDKADFIDGLFAENGGLKHHRELYIDFLKKCEGKYCTIDFYEVLWDDPKEFHEEVITCLKKMRLLDPSVIEELMNFTAIDFDRKFITLEDADAGNYEEEDCENYFHIMGASYMRDVPWE